MFGFQLALMTLIACRETLSRDNCWLIICNHQSRLWQQWMGYIWLTQTTKQGWKRGKFDWEIDKHLSKVSKPRLTWPERANKLKNAFFSGNFIKNSTNHVKWRESMYGSGLQEKKRCSLFFSLEANKSTVGCPNVRHDDVNIYG